MTRLSSLIQFSKPLTQLLMSLPSGSWNRSSSLPTSTLPPLNLDTDSRAILTRWTMDVIETNGEVEGVQGVIRHRMHLLCRNHLRRRNGLALTVLLFDVQADK